MNEARLPRTATEEAAHWHALQREGRLTADQQAAYMDWLVASPDHLREYLAISRVAGELRDLFQAAPAGDPNAAAPVTNVVAFPRKSITVESVREPPRRWRVAASAAALLVSAAVLVPLAWPRGEHDVAAHGAPRIVELADGTQLRLNAESEVATRYTWLGRRVELVRGQASFVVAKDRRPFRVHAAGLEVQDIGTTFDVSLQREQARIAVAEGEVRVLGPTGEGRPLANLQAGESARVRYRDHAVTLDHEDVAVMTAWWTGRVAFRDEPLREVADQFNRLNDVQLQLQDTAAGDLRLTGNLHGDDIDSLRAFLDHQPGLSTRRVGHRILISTRTAAR